MAAVAFVAVVGVATGPAAGQTTERSAEAVEEKAPDRGSGKASEPVVVSRAARLRAAAVQTALARAGFSPGLIDGRPGRKTQVALAEFRKAKGLAASTETGPWGVDAATADALEVSEDFTADYRVAQKDLDAVTGPIPEDWNERARLTYSGYADLTELLAERGWCTVELVRLLNPGVDVNALTAGEKVTVPGVISARPLPRIARVEVDLGEKLVRGFDASGAAVSLMHCSIARLIEKRPTGLLKVQVVATDPEYTFNPADWPEVTNVSKKLRIAPGPRNPVGSAWVGLDKPGYGMHGTVRPQDIGKTGSHGCFRLANWDAVRLARAVRIGTEVEVRE